MKIIKKQIDDAFGKKVYLLGRDKGKQKVWLEAPKWNCGWYWGFGYIRRYESNRRPSLARDIISHTHWSSEIVGKHSQYNHEKQCFVEGTDYIHHFNDNKNFVESVLTNDESWQLSDLMQSFCTLVKAAETIGKGKSNCAGVGVSFEDLAMAKNINEVKLPIIFKAIDELLSPKD